MNMGKFLLLSFFIFINGNVFSENIMGKWHRNSVFAAAELTIDSKMIFTIEAWNNANSGEITGQLTKIRDGYYFSHINDQYDSEQSCVIIVRENTKNIELMVYGDQVGAGHGVYYNGIYEREQWTDHEHTENALNSIIGNHFDNNMVKQLLGDDLEYFVYCFGSIIVKNYDNKIIIEGWLRGAAPSQNGIIKIENNNIYILITDCREGIVFRYYSTDNEQENLPEEFLNWNYYNEKIKIIGFPHLLSCPSSG